MANRPRGRPAGTVLITDQMKHEMRAMRAGGMTQQQIADEFGVSRETINYHDRKWRERYLPRANDQIIEDFLEQAKEQIEAATGARLIKLQRHVIKLLGLDPGKARRLDPERLRVISQDPDWPLFAFVNRPTPVTAELAITYLEAWLEDHSG